MKRINLLIILCFQFSTKTSRAKMAYKCRLCLCTPIKRPHHSHPSPLHRRRRRERGERAAKNRPCRSTRPLMVARSLIHRRFAAVFIVRRPPVTLASFGATSRTCKGSTRSIIHVTFASVNYHRSREAIPSSCGAEAKGKGRNHRV